MVLGKITGFLKSHLSPKSLSIGKSIRETGLLATTKQETKKFGKGLIAAGGIAASIFLPKSLSGKAFGLVSTGAVVSSPKLLKALPNVATTPLKAGETIGRAVESDKAPPILPLTLAGAGALGLGALAIAGAKKLKSKKDDAPLPAEVPTASAGEGVQPLSPTMETLGEVKKTPSRARKRRKRALQPMVRISNINRNINKVGVRVY